MSTDTEETATTTPQDKDAGGQADVDKTADADLTKEQEGLYSKDLADNGDKEAGDDKAPDKDAEGDKVEKDKAPEKEEKKELTDEEKKELEAAGAPETYEDFTLPEGVEQTEEGLKSFSEFAKAENMSQAAAQRASDFFHKRQTDDRQAQLSEYNDKVKAWTKEAMVDPDIGGKDFDTNMAHINDLLGKFSIPIKNDKGEEVMHVDHNGKETSRPVSEAMVAVGESGVGNDPRFLRFMKKVLDVVGPDYNYVTHGGTPISDKTAAETLYGDHERKHGNKQ